MEKFWKRVCFVLVLGALVVSDAGVFAQSAANLRQRVREWVLLNEELAATRTDWQERQAVMDDRIRLLQAQIDQLTDATGQTDEQLAAARDQLDTVEERASVANAALTELSAPVRQAESKARDLLDRLPDFLLDSLTIPDTVASPPADSQPEQWPARMKHALGVIEDIQRMSAQVHEGRMNVPVGEDGVEMHVLFLGLAQAFGVTPDGASAVVGRWEKGRWRWRESPDHAGVIRTALAIYRGDKPASFVSLPLARPPGRSNAPEINDAPEAME
ncbi:MAG: hypothetical protein ACOCWJ_05420 [Verrucomicrobiota bacterium]